MSPCAIFRYTSDPQVEHIVQVLPASSGEATAPCGVPNRRLRPLAVFRNARLQPFLDQPQHSVVGYSMPDELQQPLVTDVVEETLDIGIGAPSSRASLQPRVERIERLMRVTSWPKPIREAPEVRLINSIEHSHHRLLNNLVLQRRDAQRTLSPVSLRDVHSARGLCPIRATMDAAVQIDEPTFPAPSHTRAMSRRPPREPHSSSMRQNSPVADLLSHDAAKQ